MFKTKQVRLNSPRWFCLFNKHKNKIFFLFETLLLAVAKRITGQKSTSKVFLRITLLGKKPKYNADHLINKKSLVFKMPLCIQFSKHDSFDLKT